MKNEISVIPEYTADDYYNSSAPYEWLYQFKSDKFKLKQMTQKMKDKAGAVGVKCFVALFNSYCEMQAQRSDAPSRGHDLKRGAKMYGGED